MINTQDPKVRNILFNLIAIDQSVLLEEQPREGTVIMKMPISVFQRNKPRKFYR